MKRCVAMCLSIVLIVSVVLGIEPMRDVRAATEAGVYTNNPTSEGLSFQPNATYETGGALKDGKAIATLSSWVYIPTDHTTSGGVVLGNYGKDSSVLRFSFQIQSNGVPYFFHYTKGTELTFKNVDVRSDKWAHLVFTISVYEEDSVKKTEVKCYLNGELKETQTVDRELSMKSIKNYVLGGDLRVNNSQYFKGRIKELALYEEVLNAEQITTLYEEGLVALSSQPFSYYDLTNVEAYQNIPDQNGNNPFVTDYFYSNKQTPLTDYAYSFAVVGDTQNVTQYDARNSTTYLNKLYDWLVQNKEEKKIQYVFGVGDVTHQDEIDQWKHAQEQIQKLDGVIPYSVVRGNHDVPGYGNVLSPRADGFSEYLGSNDYKAQFQSGEFYSEDNIWNAWRTIRIGEIDYLMLSLDYGAKDDVLAWADEVISNHPNYNVIISTHAYIDDTGALYTGTMDSDGLNNGQAMYDKLISKHDNIVLVLCGHAPSDKIVYRTDNTTTSILIDQQDVDRHELNVGNTPAAIVTMLYFSEDGSHIQVECISTTRSSEAQDMYYKKANEITLDINVVDMDTCEYLVEPYDAAEAKIFLKGNNYYPEAKQDGYVFAGWYTKESCDDTCMLSSNEPQGTVYALFVPEHVLSVKAQISKKWLDDDKTNDSTGAIRFVTTVDSLRYKEVGFELSYVDSAGIIHRAISRMEDVYEKLYEIDGTSVWKRTPNHTFCSKSKYFKACTIQGLSLDTYKDIEFTIKPYWITMEGDKVYGETATKSIQQGMQNAAGFINN